MADGRWVVVLMTGGECEAYPYHGHQCVMDVLGPYTQEEARAIADAKPAWTRPHVMILQHDGD
jgi:hypothetical protein